MTDNIRVSWSVSKCSPMVAGSAAQIIGCGFVANSVLDEGGSRFFYCFEFVNGFKLARVAALDVNHRAPSA